jgi:23S rRNA pseudouridine1911/1915/1917 synthase
MNLSILNDRIVYEDSDYVALNKPSGMMVHGDGKSAEPTLADWVGEKYPGTRNVGEPMKIAGGKVLERPGIVHRIDKETSGIIVIAKNQESFAWLKSQFQERQVEKTYHAFVYGKMPLEGTIEKPIGRSTFGKFSVENTRGPLREARTDFKTLIAKNSVSFVEAHPKTGRTHQLRVHFLSLQHPIVGDKLYASRREPILGFTRLALHSSSIRFRLQDGSMLELSAELPEDFVSAKEELEKLLA